MRAAERLDLIERIGVELQHRYTFSDIDPFLFAHGVSTDGFEHGMSKRLYVKDILQQVDEAVLIRIAGELGLGTDPNSVEPPANWRGTTQFRLFISHISRHKVFAMKLRKALAHHAISGFVAHMDIHPTLEWQNEIERALHTMDAFLAMHTPGFSKSEWTQQEIGFALGRGAKVISFEMGELPTGFLAKRQAVKWESRMATDIAQEISRALAQDVRTKDKLKGAQDALREILP